MKKVITNNGKKGGWLVGKPHYDKNGKPLGGIKAVVTDAGNKPVELEGGEVIINKEASKLHWKKLSEINQSAGGGVPIGPPAGAFDEDPEEYKTGGRVIEFNPNHLPNKWILKYAEDIKKNHPEIWKLGGNIFGNEAFKNLQRAAKRGYWLDSEEWMYVKWRSYVARHKKDFRIEGVVAMLKWVDRVDKGWPYMKELIEEKISKLNKKEKKGWKTKMRVGGNVDRKEQIKTITEKLDKLDVKYTLSDSKIRLFDEIIKPVNKEDSFYDKFNDIIDLYNLQGVVKNKMKDGGNVKNEFLSNLIIKDGVIKGNYYAYVYEDEKAEKKLQKEEYDYIHFPTKIIFPGISQLLTVWEKDYQKDFKGANKLVGIVEFYFSKSTNKVLIECMTVRKDKRRKGINSFMIKGIREKFNLPVDKVGFIDATTEGEMFIESGKYNDGGHIIKASAGMLLANVGMTVAQIVKNK